MLLRTVLDLRTPYALRTVSNGLLPREKGRQIEVGAHFHEGIMVSWRLQKNLYDFHGTRLIVGIF